MQLWIGLSRGHPKLFFHLETLDEIIIPKVFHNFHAPHCTTSLEAEGQDSMDQQPPRTSGTSMFFLVCRRSSATPSLTISIILLIVGDFPDFHSVDSPTSKGLSGLNLAQNASIGEVLRVPPIGPVCAKSPPPLKAWRPRPRKHLCQRGFPKLSEKRRGTVPGQGFSTWMISPPKTLRASATGGLSMTA
jgi:hypothetical protein